MLPQGPGRSKILITADTDWRRHLDVIVESVADHGGTGCVNTSAVLVEGDPGPLAESIAERLAAMPSLPPEHSKASPPGSAGAGGPCDRKLPLKIAVGTRAWLGGDGVVEDSADGSAALRPAVYEAGDPTAPQIGVELPFPCYGWPPGHAPPVSPPLRDTLVLTVLTRDGELVGRLVDEPTIRNVYLGDRHTHWMASGVPHDGFLGDFLMWNKGIATSTM